MGQMSFLNQPTVCDSNEDNKKIDYYSHRPGIIYHHPLFIHLHFRFVFVYSFFLLNALLHVCGCILFELMMMKVVIPYDHGHKEVYNAFIMRTETEPKTAVFLAKPTETD